KIERGSAIASATNSDLRNSFWLARRDGCMSTDDWEGFRPMDAETSSGLYAGDGLEAMGVVVRAFRVETLTSTARVLCRLTFDMRGGRQPAKPDVGRPLDGRVRRLHRRCARSP